MTTKSKYFIESCYHLPDGILLYKRKDNYVDKELVARFFEPNARTNAQKVCDLLNETSKSKGEYPRGSTTT